MRSLAPRYAPLEIISRSAQTEERQLRIAERASPLSTGNVSCFAGCLQAVWSLGNEGSASLANSNLEWRFSRSWTPRRTPSARTVVLRPRAFQELRREGEQTLRTCVLDVVEAVFANKTIAEYGTCAR